MRLLVPGSGIETFSSESRINKRKLGVTQAPKSKRFRGEPNINGQSGLYDSLGLTYWWYLGTYLVCVVYGFLQN